MVKNSDYRLVRGMKDLVNHDAEKFDCIVRVATELAEKYNFQHLITPIVEYTSLFERNLGNESDIVHKEIYRFEDRGGDLLALRPEMTAGVCRFVIENGLFQGPFPHKYFSYGPVFRYDRPQKGRYRQFHQLNFEIFGMREMAPEIRVYLAMIRELFDRIGIKDVVLKINHLGTASERAAYTMALRDYLTKYESDLSEDSRRRLRTNVLRILDSKDAGDRQILQQAPILFDYLSNEQKAFLQSFDDRCQIDYSLVRGLDYYSGFVFEVVTDKIGETQNACCGGGEYNNLIEDMSGKKLSAFGFALGIERLFDLMDASRAVSCAPLYVHLTNKGNLVDNARNEINLAYSNDLTKGLKYANQIGANFVIFETDGILYKKDLSTGEQTTI